MPEKRTINVFLVPSGGCQYHETGAGAGINALAKAVIYLSIFPVRIKAASRAIHHHTSGQDMFKTDDKVNTNPGNKYCLLISYSA